MPMPKFTTLPSLISWAARAAIFSLYDVVLKDAILLA